MCPAPFPPVSCSFPQSHLSPQCCLYDLEGQPENSWPLGGKYCMVSNPTRYSGLHFPRFLQYLQQQHLSVNLVGRETGTQCLLQVHLLASLQGTGLQGTTFATLGVSPAGHLGPNPYHPSPKVPNIPPQSNLHSTFMEHLLCCLLSICS